MEGILFVDVDYCQFSDWGYQKPTRIWGSPLISKLNPKLCNFYTCPNVTLTEKGTRKHREALGGTSMKASVKQKGRIPPGVIDYLLTAISPDPQPTTQEPEVSQQHSQVLEWEVPERCLRKVSNYALNKMTRVGKHAQLMIEMDIILPNDEPLRISALVDAGAQVNLVKSGLCRSM